MRRESFSSRLRVVRESYLNSEWIGEKKKGDYGNNERVIQVTHANEKGYLMSVEECLKEEMH